ncbi:MAG: aldo/keto reductase [Paracoccus sp. (in: a-proteobacteria)]|nr:aldo/keto reductase [Paracoccus sp. (in: a-proteobacteria)]
MKRVNLGRDGIEVSEICLGTMTFGNQTPEACAHAQMDRALDRGITFLDCAEMYPVNPVKAETAGNSERIIGNWLAKTGSRNRVELATKIVGKGSAVRDGAAVTGASVREAVDASLRRLQSDHIDLYQIHWPNRGSYAFRQNWHYDPSGQNRDETLAHIDDVLGALSDLVDAGKIRAFGLSNDTTWGTIRWIDAAERGVGPRVASVQNEYSLLYRLFDLDFAEAAVNEGFALLAYSPLAAGLLTGKYQGGAIPEGSRAAVDIANGGSGSQAKAGVGSLGGRRTERAMQAVGALQDLAAAHGVDLVHLSLNWLLTRPFQCVPILGATTDAQLAHQLEGLGQPVSAELCKEIDRLNRECPMPY